jgi:sugar phosphate isomerase/epimerase
MKLAFSSLGCPNFNVDQIIACAKEYSYDGVELRMLESTLNLWETKSLNSANLTESYRKFKDSGVKVVIIDANGSFTNPDPAVRKAQMESLKRFAEIAQALDSPYMRVFAGPIQEGQTMQDALKWDIEGYEEAVYLMDRYGVMLLFETHDDFSLSRELLPLLTGLNDKAGVVWDIIHPLRFGESLEDTWNFLGPYIKHIHTKDSLIISPIKEESFSFIGEGILPLRQMIGIVRDNNWDGYLSFEWEKGWHPEIPSCEIAFPHYINYMRKYMG